MNLEFSEEEKAFETEVQCFLRDKLPLSLSEMVRTGKRLTKEDYQHWHSILNERGWLAVSWPPELGGPGWSFVQRYIFEVESARAHAPRVVGFGVSLFASVLIKYGSDDQKQMWLPRILDGTDWWCQGYSEPGAGSDLASLTTRAVREGDHYVVNGQKTWTTFAQYANMIFCLVRTDPSAKKQNGISFLAIDMTAPGVEVRPIKLMDGEHEVNEVFFTDVRVPVGNLIGEENKGWTYAKYLLAHERTGTAGVGESLAAFGELKRIADAEVKGGCTLSQDPIFAARLARLEIDIENLRITNLRMLSTSQSGAASMAESAMLKIRGTEIRQEITATARRAIGPYAQPYVSEALDSGYNGAPIGPAYAASITPDYLNNRKLTIYGGSNEVQREIITKTMLEL